MESIFIYNGIEYIDCGTVEDENGMFLILKSKDEPARYFFLKKENESWILPSKKEQEELSSIYKNDFDGKYYLLENIVDTKRSNVLDEGVPQLYRDVLEKALAFAFEFFADDKFDKKNIIHNVSSLTFYHDKRFDDKDNHREAEYSATYNMVSLPEKPEEIILVHEIWHMFSAKLNILLRLMDRSPVGLSNSHGSGTAINEGVTQYLAEQTCCVEDTHPTLMVFTRIVKMLKILYGDTLFQCYLTADQKGFYDSASKLGYSRNDLINIFSSSDALLNWELYVIDTYNKTFDKTPVKIRRNEEALLNLIISGNRIKKQKHIAKIELKLLQMLEIYIKKIIDNNEITEEIESLISNIFEAFGQVLVIKGSFQYDIETKLYEKFSVGLEEVELKYNEIIKKSMIELEKRKLLQADAPSLPDSSDKVL